MTRSAASSGTALAGAAMWAAACLVACGGSSGSTPGRGGAGGDAGVATAQGGHAGIATAQGGAAGAIGGGSGAAGCGRTDGGGDGCTSGNLVGSSGGSVSDPTGSVTLTILPGWLLGDTRFTFTPVDSIAGLPADYVLVPGSGWQIDWTGAGFSPARFAEVAIVPRIQAGPAAAAVPGVVQAPGLFTDVCGYEWTCYSYSSADCANLPRPCGNGGSSPGTGSAHVAQAQHAPQAAYPAITTEPKDVTVPAGAAASFSVATTNASSLQWLRNGTSTGVTSSMFSLNAAQVTDSGARFSVVASDGSTFVYSRSAQLTVSGPSPPAWNSSMPGSFKPGIGAPQVGMYASALDSFAFAVWNEGGVLHSDHEGMNTWLDALPQAARGQPQVLSALLNFTGFIVFIADDGTSSCAGSTGNLLVALAFGADAHSLAGRSLSAPITLYRSASDCVETFSADAVSTKTSLLPPGTVGLVYALAEVTAKQIKVGVAGAGQDVGAANGWVPLPGTAMTLPLSQPCGGPTRFAPSLAGDEQTALPGGGSESDRDPASPLATVAWVVAQAGGDVLCASTLAGTAWGQAVQVFAPVAGPPNVAMRATGDAAVLAAGQGGAAAAGGYSTTAAFRPAAGAGWHVDQLAPDDQAPVPFATFSADGSLFATWTRTSGKSVSVNAARRTPNAAWEPAFVLSDGAATSAGYARIYADDAGNAVALYGQTLAGSPMQIWSRRFGGGAWSDASRVQSSGNEGTVVDCQRYQTGSSIAGNFATTNPFAAWRETDPTDATRFTIVTAD